MENLEVVVPNIKVTTGKNVIERGAPDLIVKDILEVEAVQEIENI